MTIGSWEEIFAAVAKGAITAEEGNAVGALIERRASHFHTVELQDEMYASGEAGEDR